MSRIDINSRTKEQFIGDRNVSRKVTLNQGLLRVDYGKASWYPVKRFGKGRDACWVIRCSGGVERRVQPSTYSKWQEFYTTHAV